MKLDNTYYIGILLGIIVLSLSQKLNNKVKEGLDDLPCEVYTSLKTIEDILNGTTKLKTLDQTVPCLIPGKDKYMDYTSDVADKAYSFNDIIQNIFLSGKILMTTSSSANTDATNIYTMMPIFPILTAFVIKINTALDVILKESKNTDAMSYLTQILNNNVFYFIDNKIKYCANLKQALNYCMIIARAIFSTGAMNSEKHNAFLCFFMLIQDKNTFLTKRIREMNHKLKNITYNSASLDCSNTEPPFITNLSTYFPPSDKTDFLNSGKTISLDKQYSGGNVMKDVKFKECPLVTSTTPVSAPKAPGPATTQKAPSAPAPAQKAPATTQKAPSAPTTTQKAPATTQKAPSAPTTTQKAPAVKSNNPK
jgi:hypothetical protein